MKLIDLPPDKRHLATYFLAQKIPKLKLQDTPDRCPFSVIKMLLWFSGVVFAAAWLSSTQGGINV